MRSQGFGLLDLMVTLVIASMLLTLAIPAYDMFVSRARVARAIGDGILTQTSERIVSVVRAHDTVARLGGDEFVVVLPNVRNESIVRGTADRLLNRLSEAFTVSGNDHYLSASIGIAMFPNDAATLETLLKNADAAMYRASVRTSQRYCLSSFIQDPCLLMRPDDNLPTLTS